MDKQTHMTFLFAKTAALGKKTLSIELYPLMPYDAELVNSLNPSFYALTWQQGDLTKVAELPTISVGKKLLDSSKQLVMHVAGRNLKRENALQIVNEIKRMGVKNILALQGASRETDDSKCEFPYGLEFLQFVRKEFGDYFNMATSGYPIGHPSAADPIKDLEYLKKKVDAGADFIMCQGVFDLKAFKDFYKRCRALEIDVPILASVYAINSFDLLKNLMGFCKVIPEDYVNTMEKLAKDEEAITNYAANYLSDLIKSLLTDKEISIPGIHIFCFNNLSLVEKIFKKLNFTELNVWQPSH